MWPCKNIFLSKFNYKYFFATPIIKKGATPKYAYALTSNENLSIEYSMHLHNKIRTHNWLDLDSLLTQWQKTFYRPLTDQLTMNHLFMWVIVT